MRQPWRCGMISDRWMRRTVAGFQPYQVAPIHEKRVINANENYVNILDIPSVREDAEKLLSSFRPQIYPAPMADSLRESLAEYMGTAPDCILAGNGGDEMITYTMGTFLNPGDRVLIHQPTFDMYEAGAAVLGAETVKVPDLPGFHRNWEGLLEAVRQHSPKITFICSPNNPTGEAAPLSRIREIAEASEYPVVVDEAYMEFANGKSAVSLIPDHPNVIVLRTLSKAFGMAGLRCGYIVAAPEVILAVAKVKNPYNLNAFTQAMGCIALRHRREILKVRDRITAERDRFFKELETEKGIRVYPSQTNFLLMDAGASAERLFAAWRKADILVKRFSGKPELEQAFRVTITTEETDRMVLQVIREVTHSA